MLLPTVLIKQMQQEASQQVADEEADATSNLVEAQDELAVKQAILRYRVREIYKRGPLYSLEALLSAQSFGALVARYKYLHLVTQRDRALVRRVEMLNDQVSGTRTQLVRLRGEMELSREQKSEEERRLRELDDNYVVSQYQLWKAAIRKEAA